MQGRSVFGCFALLFCLFVRSVPGQDWSYLDITSEESEDSGPAQTRPAITCDGHASPRICSNLARVTVHNLNQQVRQHLTANYQYTAMFNYFERADQSYRGFAKLFQFLAGDHLACAERMMKYINSRGGQLHLKPIQDPEQEWPGPVEALNTALTTEKTFVDSLLDVLWMAQEKNDPHLQHEIEGQYLDPQVNKLKKLSDHLTIVQRLHSDAVGLNVYDQWLFEGKR